jgi:hypothetical protein
MGFSPPPPSHRNTQNQARLFLKKGGARPAGSKKLYFLRTKSRSRQIRQRETRGE